MRQVSLTSLKKSFGKTPVIEGFNLEIAKGEFVALLGPSGCGKSTLLRIMAGLETADSGSLEIAGREVGNLPPEKRNVALMFQSYALLPHMTVLENVRFPLRMQAQLSKAEQRAKAREALELVQLENHAERYPRQLSGGQQQRVALARSIVVAPDLLLLDEPLSNLDALLRDEMQVQLKRLHEKLGLTTVFVTHDQEEALALANRVVLMNRGRIEREGAPQEIYNDPGTRFAANFIGRANLFSLNVRKTADGFLGEFDDGSKTKLNTQKHLAEGVHHFMVRKEAVRLETSLAQSILRGEVVAQNYLGSRVRFVVKVGTQIVEAIANGNDTDLTGQQVGLSWSDDDFVLLDREQAVDGDSPA